MMDQPGSEPEQDTDAAPASLAEHGRVAVLKHHRASRWMHWINFPLLTIMIWSGMRIYWADLRDPFAVGVGDFDFEFWPAWVNEQLGFERRLARGMAFHFSFGWLFAINGFFYVLYTVVSGEWRQLVPERKSVSDAIKVFLHDIGLRRGKPLPPQARYNGAQRLTYTAVIVMGAIALYSGFAIYKPTQLGFMTRSLGGYEWAKGIHFTVTIGFIVFFVIHILQVMRAGFSNFWSMVTGYEVVDAPEVSGRSPLIDDPPHDGDGELIPALVGAADAGEADHVEG